MDRMVKSSRSEIIRHTLRSIMKFRGLTPSAWSQKAGLSEGTLRNFLAGTSDTMTVETIYALAKAISLRSYQLTGEIPLETAEPLRVTIHVHEDEWIADWRGADDYSDAPTAFDIVLPLDPRFQAGPRWGAAVVDDSANRYYPRGSILVCTPLESIGRPLQEEDKVLFLRAQPREIGPPDHKMTLMHHEVTIKKVVSVRPNPEDLRHQRYWFEDAKKDRVSRSYAKPDKPCDTANGISYYEHEDFLIAAAALITASYRLESTDAWSMPTWAGKPIAASE